VVPSPNGGEFNSWPSPQILPHWGECGASRRGISYSPPPKDSPPTGGVRPQDGRGVFSPHWGSAAPAGGGVSHPIAKIMQKNAKNKKVKRKIS